jgi:hypothetical protein
MSVSDTKRYNPFKPNHPIHPGMFTGRVLELDKIDSLIGRLKHGNPANILIYGERGIGKTSLLIFTNVLAKGKITWKGQEPYNYLSIQFNLNENITQLELIRKIQRALQRQLSREENALSFIKKTWEFLQRIEIADSRIRSQEQETNAIEVFDNFVYSLADTVNTLTSDSLLSEKGIRSKKDGLVILIDEADSASSELRVGAFLKNLSEGLIVEGCYKVQFVLSGLPRTRNILASSHESSLRLFEQLELLPLERDDIKMVYQKGLDEVNDRVKNDKYSIDPEALEIMTSVSEGYPHFAQQIGYSTFDWNTDECINETTANAGIFDDGGAIDLIGDRYYYDMYYNKIKEESYREILQIMAEKANQWVTRQEILSKFNRKPQILDNGIKALKNRNIILPKQGVRGVYRLQWIGFGYWIKFFTSRTSDR